MCIGCIALNVCDGGGGGGGYTCVITGSVWGVGRKRENVSAMSDISVSFLFFFFFFFWSLGVRYMLLIVAASSSALTFSQKKKWPPRAIFSKEYFTPTDLSVTITIQLYTVLVPVQASILY